MIDWSLPIVGIPTAKGAVAGVGPIDLAVDQAYHGSPNNVPVRLPCNLWVRGGTRGTWYFTNDGESIGGKNEEGGQDALWSVRNKPL